MHNKVDLVRLYEACQDVDVEWVGQVLSCLIMLTYWVPLYTFIKNNNNIYLTTFSNENVQFKSSFMMTNITVSLKEKSCCLLLGDQCCRLSKFCNFIHFQPVLREFGHVPAFFQTVTCNPGSYTGWLRIITWSDSSEYQINIPKFKSL